MKLSPCMLPLIAVLIASAKATVVVPASNVDANHVKLYQNPSASMADQQFTVPFSSNFTLLPTFAFGINNYALNDRFFFQDFNSAQTGLTLTHFLINVTSVGATNLLLFSVSYIAIQDSSFQSQLLHFSNAANISSGTGDRYLEQIYSNLTFSSASVSALPLLTGFHIDSNTFFGVNASATVLNSSSYLVRLDTLSDCLLLQVDLYILFYSTTSLDSNNYYYLQDIISSTNTTAVSFLYSVDYKPEVQYLMGLRGFDGDTTKHNIRWGWILSTVANSTQTFDIDKFELLNIDFSFLAIARYQVEVQESSSSSLGVIAGAVCGAVVLTVVIVIVACRKCRDEKANEVHPVHPSIDQDYFKQMPTLVL